MLQDFFKLLLDYSVGIIPLFVFALLISALLSEALPDSFYEKVLSAKGFTLVIASSIIGALIPLCTCGTIPLASKLKEKGASWLIVISFLTSGNASSITALLLTLAVGLKITLLRFLFAVVFGILASYIFVLIFKPESMTNKKQDLVQEQTSRKLLVRKVLKEFRGLVLNFSPWVLAAILVASIIGVFLKPHQVVSFAGVHNLFAPFLFSLLGFPFYFCAGADVPIAKSLLVKGAGLGSILAFMTSAPGINLTSFLIYQRWLGLKDTITYLLISVLVCGLLGLAINTILLPLTPYELR